MFDFLKKNPEYEADKKYIKSIAKCPLCNKEVIESGDYWACVGGIGNSCSFKISSIHEGERLSIEDLNNFQNIESASKFLGDIYKARCAKEEKERQRVEKERQRKLNHRHKDNIFFKDGKELAWCRCPKCDSSLYRRGDTVKCLPDNADCDFEMDTAFLGVSFSYEELANLFSGFVSQEYLFNNGKRGRVFLDIDKDIKRLNKYKFITDIESFVLEEKSKNPKSRYIEFVYYMNHERRRISLSGRPLFIEPQMILQ